MNIFTLTGNIFVDNEKANNSIAKTDEKAKGLADRLGDGVKTAGKWALGVGAAAGAVGGAMLGLATKAAESTDRIDKMSNKIGISKQAFQEWDYVMAQNGMDIDKMQVGMKTLTNAMDSANNGSKGAIENFKTLGLTWDDGNGKLKSQEQMMNEAIMALAGMENGTEKARLATELFGKAGVEMMPMLNGGAAGIEELKNRSHELGLVMSDEAVNAGVLFGDTMDDVKDTFGAVVTKIGIEVMPIVQKLLDWILEHMPEIQEVIRVVFTVATNVITAVYNVVNDYILPVMSTLFAWIQDNMPTIQKVFKTVFGFIWDIVSEVWRIFSEDLLPILIALWDFISPTFPLIQGVVEVTFGAIVEAVEFVVDVFDRVTGAIKTAIEWLGSWNDTDAEEKNVGTSSGSKRVNGSHAAGLAYVPFDGYVAELHEGEKVLTAQEARQQQNNNTSTINITGNNFVIREEADIKKISRELQKQINNKKRGTQPA